MYISLRALKQFEMDLTEILIVLGAVSAVLALLYRYFAYAPIPDAPVLKGTLSKDTLKVEEQGTHHIPKTTARERTLLSYIPATLKPRPALLIVLHGTGLNGTKMRQWTGYEFDQLAERHGFVVVYPDGYKENWNDCRKDTPFAAKKENIDDISFLHAIINRYKTAHDIDKEKVYLFGFSNGGQMAYRMAMENPGSIAGITSVAANMPEPSTSICSTDGPTPRVLLINGTADSINPYKGGEVKLFGKKIGMAISAHATAVHFATRNNALQHMGERSLQAGSITEEIWLKADVPYVKNITLHKAGHTIPQPSFRFPRILGKTARNYNSPAEACKFFGIADQL